jgi:hypothetical protein
MPISVANFANSFSPYLAPTRSSEFGKSPIVSISCRDHLFALGNQPLSFGNSVVPGNLWLVGVCHFGGTFCFGHGGQFQFATNSTHNIAD